METLDNILLSFQKGLKLSWELVSYGCQRVGKLDSFTESIIAFVILYQIILLLPQLSMLTVREIKTKLNYMK